MPEGTPPRQYDDRTCDERALVAEAIRGVPQAQNALIDRYKRLVYSIPRRYLLPAEVADDVFQEVFLRFFRSLSGIGDPAAVPKWLITTTHRECWRAARRRGMSEPVASELSAPTLRVDRVADWEEQSRVQIALSDLGGRCERLLRMLFMARAEPSYEAISMEIG
ncbi:MAG: RNA polymerase sigma factor, partial [Phycisphaerales bacterium]